MSSEHLKRREPDGSIFEDWYQNNRLHREDGPACVETRPDGTKIEEWRRNDHLLRYVKTYPGFVE
jgi:hypothetical protein